MRMFLFFLVASSCWGSNALSQSLDYGTIRMIAAQMYSEGAYDEGEFYIDNSNSRVIYLQGCSRASLSGGYFESDDDYTRGLLEEVAMQVITMRGTLLREGFGMQSWEPVLQQFEQQALSLVERHSGEAGHDDFFDPYFSLLQSTVTTLAETLGASPASGRIVSDDVDGECGDGGIWVQVSTTPPGGRVWLMSEFDFRLCQLLGHDPWTSEKCRLVEYSDSDLALVSGNYRFLARWPDGAESRGIRSFMAEFLRTGSEVVRIMR